MSEAKFTPDERLAEVEALVGMYATMSGEWRRYVETVTPDQRGTGQIFGMAKALDQMRECLAEEKRQAFAALKAAREGEG